MLLKYIFFFLLFIVGGAYAQMPNLKNNALNAPTDTQAVTSMGGAVVMQDGGGFNEGNIFLGYGDVVFSKTAGGQDMCDITIKLKNATIYPLVSLKVTMEWPSWRVPISFSNFTQTEENSKSYRLMGGSCYRLNEKPKIALTKCIIGDKSINECGKMIKVMTSFDF